MSISCDHTGWMAKAPDSLKHRLPRGRFHFAQATSSTTPPAFLIFRSASLLKYLAFTTIGISGIPPFPKTFEYPRGNRSLKITQFRRSSLTFGMSATYQYRRSVALFVRQVLLSLLQWHERPQLQSESVRARPRKKDHNEQIASARLDPFSRLNDLCLVEPAVSHRKAPTQLFPNIISVIQHAPCQDLSPASRTGSASCGNTASRPCQSTPGGICRGSCGGGAGLLPFRGRRGACGACRCGHGPRRRGRDCGETQRNCK